MNIGKSFRSRRALNIWLTVVWQTTTQGKMPHTCKLKAMKNRSDRDRDRRARATVPTDTADKAQEGFPKRLQECPAQALIGSWLGWEAPPATSRASSSGTSSTPAGPPKASTPSPIKVAAKADCAATESRFHHRHDHPALAVVCSMRGALRAL